MAKLFEEGYPPPREKWVRIEEREKESTPAPEINGWLETQRIIFRAGYWISPMDMPMDELRERAIRHVVNAMNKYHKKLPELTIIHGTLYDHIDLLDEDTDSYEGPFTKASVSLLLEILRLSERGMFNRVFYSIRRKWYLEQKRTGHPQPVDIRTFWYYDLPQPKNFMVLKKQRKQTGKYNFGYTWTDYDYDPPYLNQWTSQELYRITDHWVPEKDDYVKLFVHPLDIIRRD